jgi:hypothetical protein
LARPKRASKRLNLAVLDWQNFGLSLHCFGKMGRGIIEYISECPEAGDQQIHDKSLLNESFRG